MQVDSLLKIIDKATAVLELYRGSSIEEMLDDIYRLASDVGVGARPESAGGLKKRSKAADKLPPREVVAMLPGMTEEERQVFLSAYTINDLKLIAPLLGIKLPAKLNKRAIIAMIAAIGDRSGPVSDNDENDSLSAKPAVDGRDSLLTGGNRRGERLSRAVAAVQEMNEEEIMELLKAFNKSEILEIARRNNFKISSSNTKDNIIIMLAKNLGFKDLSRRISQRPRQE